LFSAILRCCSVVKTISIDVAPTGTGGADTVGVAKAPVGVATVAVDAGGGYCIIQLLN
jgi:hypothetical protein